MTKSVFLWVWKWGWVNLWPGVRLLWTQGSNGLSVTSTPAYSLLCLGLGWPGCLNTIHIKNREKKQKWQKKNQTKEERKWKEKKQQRKGKENISISPIWQTNEFLWIIYRNSGWKIVHRTITYSKTMEHQEKSHKSIGDDSRQLLHWRVPTLSNLPVTLHTVVGLRDEEHRRMVAGL